MLSIESVGKNLDQAISNGLAELKVSRDDVEIKIIDAGGFFKKAKVLITVDKEVEAQLLAREENIKRLEREFGEEEKVEEKQEEKVEEKQETEVKEKQEKKEVNFDELPVGACAAVEFLKGLLSEMKLEADFDVDVNDEDIKITINGENVGDVIGYRGEGLNAIQYIASIIANKRDRECGRVLVDVSDYKERRKQSLIKMARRMAVKVAKTKHRLELEPMNAYERKIIHTALQNDSFVTTHSVGEEPRRRIVIELK